MLLIFRFLQSFARIVATAVLLFSVLVVVLAAVIICSIQLAFAHRIHSRSELFGPLQLALLCVFPPLNRHPPSQFWVAKCRRKLCVMKLTLKLFKDFLVVLILSASARQTSNIVVLLYSFLHPSLLRCVVVVVLNCGPLSFTHHLM